MTISWYASRLPLSLALLVTIFAPLSARAQDTPAPGAAPPKEAAPAKIAPSAEAIAQGKTLLAAAVKAHGGETFLNLLALKAVGKGVVQAPDQAGGGEIPVDFLNWFYIAPDKMRMEMETGFGAVTAVRPGDGKPGWVVFGGQVRNDPNEDGARLIPVTVLVQATKENLAVAALSDVPAPSADGKKLKGFSVTDAKGREMRLYIEEETNLLRRAETMTGSETIALELSGNKEFSGVTLPTGIQLKRGGKAFMTFTLSRFDVNPKLEPSLFVRPAAESATTPEKAN